MSKWHRGHGVFNLVLQRLLPTKRFDMSIDYFKLILHLISLVVNFGMGNYNLSKLPPWGTKPELPGPNDLFLHSPS